MQDEPTITHTFYSDGGLSLGNGKIGLGAFSDNLYLGFDGTASFVQGKVIINASGDIQVSGRVVTFSDVLTKGVILTDNNGVPKLRLSVDAEGGLAITPIPPPAAPAP